MGKNVRLQIWDTCGKEMYRISAQNFYRSALCIFVVFSLDSLESFNKVNQWIEEIKENNSEDYILVLVGNKSDLTPPRKIEKEVIEQYCKNNGIDNYFEVSAKSGDKVHELFKAVVRQLFIKFALPIINDVREIQSRENDLLAELLMMPRNNAPNVKYNVEINHENDIITNHGYNFMKLKNKKNNIDLYQDINIQKPDKNILKIDDIVKNEKIQPKFNFRKSKGHEISKTAPILNKDKDITLGTNADNYISKYSNYKIKNDEDYQQISNIHEDLINTILQEEDNFISEHKNHIDSMVKSIKDEMSGIHEVEKPGSNIEEYTSNLDKILSQEIETITKLRTKLNKFRILLKDESALANLFGDDEIILGSDDDEYEQKTTEDYDYNKEFNKKSKINEI
jgi:small GTP-binding protein